MPGGYGSGNGGLFLAVKKLLHNPSFFRSRGDNDLSIGSPRKNSRSSSSIQRGTLSPSQSSVLSEESLPRNAGNKLGFDIERDSLKSSEGRLENSVFSADEDSQHGHTSPASFCTPRVSRNSSISSGALMNNVSCADEDSQQGHNQATTASPASSCTPRVSRSSSISSGAFQGKGSSSSHPRPYYEESLPIIAGNEQGSDIERMPLNRSEDGLAISVSQFYTFPLTNNVSSADEDFQQDHNQTTSASPDSSCTHVSRNSSIFSGAYQGEGLSLSHPRSCSGESLPIIACNELWFDDEMISPESSEDRYISMSSVHTQGYISVSPFSTISIGSLRQSSLHSSATQRESSPSYPRLSSDESLYGFARYVLSFDVETNSLKRSEEWLTSSGKGSISSVNYFSVESLDDEESYLGHHRTTSALNNPNFSRAAIGDGNQPYYFLSPVGLRSHLQSILRRACESLVPRMVSSSSTEARAYRVEVENHVKKLVEDLQVTSTDVLRNAAAELQLLASLNMDNQILIANHGAISLLINLLYSVDTKLQESAVIALLHLSTNDSNKCMLVDADAIAPLIHVLSTGSPEAQETSVATLFSLSVIEGFKVKISRAIEAVIELLANGTPRGKKDAATALYYLSILDENKYRIVQAGAVKYLIELMYADVGMVDEAVCVLSNLSSVSDGSAEICREGGIPILVKILEFGSSRAKEEAAVALLQLCTDNRRFCNMVLRLGAVSPLTELSHCSNPRAQQLAQRLLNYLRDYCNIKGDGQGVDLGRMSLRTSKDRLALSRDTSANSVSQFSMHTVSSPDEGSHLRHDQTTSVSSEKSTLNFSRAITGDGIEVSSRLSASSWFSSTIETRKKSFKLSKVGKLSKIFKLSNVEKHSNSSYSMNYLSRQSSVSYRELHNATNGFSNTNLIGYGSFGTVYRGHFRPDGEQTFAVKVLDLQKNGASMSFRSECEVLRYIRHRNVVPILTCCSRNDFEGNEFKALLYRFMENGNLDTWLHTHSAARTNVLSVLQRLNIAIDIAYALDYLHNRCEPPVIHCDLKPSNIFLDEDYTAHVGDFGLSRFYSPTIEEDSSGEQACTIGLQGSIDYIPPEYWTGAEATTFGDVYSYGILLLEMFTAKRPTDDLFSNECSLYEYVATTLPEQVMKIVDPLLLSYLESNNGSDKMLDNDRNLVEIKEGEMSSFFLSIFRMGLSCASISPLDRTLMKDVTHQLEKIKKGFSYKNKQTRSPTVSPGLNYQLS